MASTRLGIAAITARGSGAQLVVAAVLIGLIAIGMPIGLYLTGTPVGEVCGSLSPNNVVRIWLVTFGLDLVLLIFAGYYSSRRLVIDDRALTYRTWFGTRHWSPKVITGLSHQEVSDDSNTSRYLAFWSGSQRVFRINLMGWRRGELKSVLGALRAQQPALQIDPELSHWFDR